ncbi:MAG: peptidoglycan DD-metalloendopeptidase family protein [Bacteroidia bacterium]
MVWGGYQEQRLIYGNSSIFHQEQSPRNIHLGLDFWMDAGEKVYSPLDGTIHSLQDNDAFGDYGPTIIVQHWVRGTAFHLLYGHLGRASLLPWQPGQQVTKGDLIGCLGAPDENGNWPPHLHFQIIIDMEGKQGDYPGVCSVETLKHYSNNCPDPRFLLGL